MSNAAGLYDQDMDEVPRRRLGRPSRLDAATVQRALDQARAEHRARGLSGEPVECR